MNLEEIRSGAVHFVHKHHPRNGIAIGLSPDRFRLRLNTANGAEHCDHPVENTHGAFNFNGEVDVSRGIDDVDAVVFPARGNGRCRNGDPSLPLLGHPVGDGSTVMHLANFVHHA